MHPRITRLYINNYRCFVNFELRPERRSLLLGYNGTGKSSILDVLVAIRSLVFANSDAKQAFPSDTVTKFAGASDQRFEIDVETEHGVMRYVLHLSHDIEQETVTIAHEELTVDGKPSYRFSGGSVFLSGDDGHATKEFPFTAQRSFLASLDPKDPVSPISAFKAFFGGLWSMSLDPMRMDAVAPSEHSGFSRDGSNFASLCRHLLQESPDLMQRAHEALQEIIPGFQHLRMQSAGRAKVLVATFRHPGGKTYDIDFDRLSEGQKTLVVLYVVLHGTARLLRVLCLDEPDNFVSIREIQPFLTELADTSDETGLQVLTISHSAEVIDYLGASNVILLERPNGGHVRVGTLPATGALRLSELMARGWLAEGTNGAS